jgi:hypothetical protein
MPRPLFTLGKDPVTIGQEAGWAPGSVWTGAKNLVATGIRSPDRPHRSQSLYRIRYLTHLDRITIIIGHLIEDAPKAMYSCYKTSNQIFEDTEK